MQASCVLLKTVLPYNPNSNPMKSHTKLKLRFRWLILLGSALASLGLVNAPAQVTTVEIVHYFTVQGQIDALNQLQKDFETANADVKIHFTYVPFGELVSRTLQMAAVHKPPGISAVDNPDVLRVAKAGILEDISTDVAKFQVWNDLYAGPKAAVTDGSKVYGMPIGIRAGVEVIPAPVVVALDRDEAVPDVADRTDQGLVLGAELGSQPAHVHVDSPGAAEVVVAPHLLQQL
jgi:hypothetical protein